MNINSSVDSFIEVQHAESSLVGVGWDIKMRLLDPGQVNARACSESRKGHLVVSTDSVVEVSGRLPNHMFGILVLPSHSFFRTDPPVFFTSGSVAMISPETRYRIIFEQGYHEAVLIPSELVKSGTPPTVESISSWLRKYRLFEKSEELKVKLGGLSPNVSPNQDELVEKACQLIDESRDLTAPSEISGALNVGIRTLERAFSQSVRMPPSRYLAARRLNKAFRSLNDKNRKNCTVTEIALENCFSHLGRFSLNYRNLFGECPRDTLKRNRFGM